jgi:hypothetical protein
MFEYILKGRCRIMLEEMQNCLPPEDTSAAEKKKRAAEHFTTGVLTRGEAAKPQDGKLPPGATHEIVETKKGEPPKLRRRRFSVK